ncbi:MAG: glutamate-1-semialdehyde 2,1-aminomutase [Bacteriovoracaceae bacterium]|jgi:glutamate-1-semialdehyde 2,1-aminomutase|nr:glutamate-1-semialdehyde 2,1-aminomutase [Bacteriovoracaceae bacterium]
MNKSKESLFEKSKTLVPGGVHSPVRSFKGLNTTPIFIERAEGAKIYDTEGKDYIDFCMSFGPLILGHRNKTVENDLKSALERGWSFGACEPYSLELAEFITSKIDFVEQVRFVNSGTEAVMTALRLARGATKRDKIIKFNGCYHGHVDSMLIKAGSGLAGEAESSSKGIPEGVAKDTLTCELDDRETVEEIFKREGANIAAIIVEPLPANNGLLPQRKEYLQFLRDITKKNGALLIFDEVISGFRMSFSGMSGILGITPDLVTYGKIIGGGLPVGAICGKRALLENLAPMGDVYQAGTLSANPLAMVGGLSTLRQLTEENYKKLEEGTGKIVEMFREYFASKSQYAHLKVQSRGSLFWIHPAMPDDQEISSLADFPSNLAESFSILFDDFLEKGIYLAPNGYEVGFVSLAHCDQTITELRKRLWS